MWERWPRWVLFLSIRRIREWKWQTVPLALVIANSNKPKARRAGPLHWRRPWGSPAQGLCDSQDWMSHRSGTIPISPSGRRAGQHTLGERREPALPLRKGSVASVAWKNRPKQTKNLKAGKDIRILAAWSILFPLRRKRNKTRLLQKSITDRLWT